MKFRASPSWSATFRHAWRGLRVAFRGERSFRFQLLMGVLALFCGWFLRLSSLEMAVLALVTALVLVLELVNSSLERFIDLAKPRLDEGVRDVKDILAGAVFVASLAAVVVGVSLLFPKLLVLAATL